MVKRFFYSLIMAAAVIGCDTEQDVVPSKQSTFTRYFGSQHNHTAHQVVEAHNGFTMLSTIDIAKDNLGQFVYKIRVIHTDMYGNLKWTREYPSFESEKDENGVYDVGKNGSFKASSFTTTENGYLIIGESIKLRADNSKYSELLVIEIDQSGNVVKGRQTSLPNDDLSLQGKAVVQDEDGSIIVLAQILEPSNSLDMFVAKLSSSTTSDQYDSVVWQQTYGDGKNTLANRLYRDDGNKLFWGGTVKMDNTPEQARLLFSIQNDASATPSSRDETELKFNESVSDFCKAPNGYLMVGATDQNPATGSTGSNIFAIKMSSQLSLVKSMPPTDFNGQNDRGNSIAYGVNGGAVVLATVQSGSTKGNGKEDLFLIKLDSDFEIEWSQNYGGSEPELAASVVSTSDNGYLMFGTASFGGLNKLILMKVTSDGSL